MAISGDAYARMLKYLLPPGLIWTLETTGRIANMLRAIADELERIGQRGVDLVNESDPRMASETLEDWERVTGLPDEAVTAIPGTDAGRRLAITSKLTTRGGQHAQFYIDLAAACGYTVTISDPYSDEVFRAGDRCGSRIYGAGRAYEWVVTVSPPSGAALTHAELEAIIERAAPAHTSVSFVYL